MARTTNEIFEAILTEKANEPALSDLTNNSQCSKCGKVLRYDFEIEIDVCEMCQMELVQGIVLPKISSKK